MVTVTTSSAHGAAIGDFVTFASLTAVIGLTTDNLNKEHVVVSVPSTTTFTVNTGGSATSGSVAGGGSSGTAAFQLNIGLDSTVLGPGWGAGTGSIYVVIKRGFLGRTDAAFVVCR